MSTHKAGKAILRNCFTISGIFVKTQRLKMIKELKKKEFVDMLRENGFSTKEINTAWLNAKRRRGVA